MKILPIGATRSAQTPARNLATPLLLVSLVGLLLIALWLRWRYIQSISLYVDEFTTLWAAKRVQQLGAPIMPSGVLYTRGLLASYVEALFLTLFGFSYTVGRLPSLLFGLATIVATFLIGRRLWSARVGWLAAVGLTLLPEAIVWSSRARFYAQLQFFVLLLVWAAFAMTAGPASTSKRMTGKEWLFVTLFILALFSQEETLLLYPSILLGLLLWRGWRYFRQPSVWATHAICLAALIVRYAVEKIGQPGYFETIQAQRPYVGLIFDLRGAWAAYAPLLIGWERLPWTLGALLAIVIALATLPKVGWRLSQLPRSQQATLFFALQFLFVLSVILALVGTSWREGRYLFLVQPLWLLTGAAGAIWLLDRLLGSPRWSGVGTVVLTGLIFALLLPKASAVLEQQVEGYDQALAYLVEARQPGDVVLSPQPPACALALGACDYYALQRGYEEFVIQRDGVLIDRWTGSKLLNTTQQLEAALRRAPHTWLITDSFRLATRYEADFVRMVVEQFDLAFEERGVMVLRADGWRDRSIPETTTTLDPPQLLAPLALTGWERTVAAPGADLHVTLFWQSTQTIDRQINTSLRLVASDGTVVTAQDGPPARGLIPTLLIFDQPVPDLKTLALPATVATGRYRLEISAYDVATVTHVGPPLPFEWFTIGPPPAAPGHPVDARWVDGLQLIGTDPLPSTIQAGEAITLRLVWAATAPVAQDYTVFLHLVDGTGQPVAQRDQQPGGDFYPTAAWQVGDWVADAYPLTVPADVAGGEYSLLVGLYDPANNQRLLLPSGEDTFLLGKLQVAQRQ